MVLTTFDTATGEYEIEVRNLSQPGRGIDYDLVKTAMRRIYGHFDRRVGDVREATDAEVAPILSLSSDEKPS